MNILVINIVFIFSHAVLSFDALHTVSIETINSAVAHTHLLFQVLALEDVLYVVLNLCTGKVNVSGNGHLWNL